MSQYGAYGFAQNGSGYRDILAHYYTGTAIGNLDPARRVRVLLQSTAATPPSPARRAPAGAGCRRARTYFVRRRGARVSLLSPRRKRMGTYSALRVTGRGGEVILRGRAANGRVSGAYRGALDFRAGTFSGVDAVNSLPLDSYLRGVVPDESPAVVADRGAQGAGRRGPHLRRGDDEARRHLRPLPRHALAGLRRRGGRGASTNQAIAATRGEVVTYNGQPVVTFFFSTSGGRTEDVENTPLGNEPRPWLKSVDDPYDDTSPRHRWGPIRMSLKQADAKLGSYVKGAFRGIEVVQPRPLAADRGGRRHRHPRAHPRDRRHAARALRPVRLVGVLHLDHDRRRAAAREHRGPGRADGRHGPVRLGRALGSPAGRRGRRARAAGAARRARDAAAARQRALA